MRQVTGQLPRSLAGAELRAVRRRVAPFHLPQRLRDRIGRLRAHGGDGVVERREQHAPELRPLEPPQPTHRQAAQQGVATAQRIEQRRQPVRPRASRVLGHEQSLQGCGIDCNRAVCLGNRVLWPQREQAEAEG